jgi:hypothetical protein
MPRSRSQVYVVASSTPYENGAAGRGYPDGYGPVGGDALAAAGPAALWPRPPRKGHQEAPAAGPLPGSLAATRDNWFWRNHLDHPARVICTAARC